MRQETFGPQKVVVDTEGEESAISANENEAAKKDDIDNKEKTPERLEYQASASRQ